MKIFGEGFSFAPRKKIWQLRANTLKIGTDDLERRLREKYKKVEKVGWYEDAFLVESEGNLVKSLEYNLGYFFLQNLSSMIPPLVLEPNGEDRLLDLAAAPGAKTTQIAAIMKNWGVIVSNDVTNDRLKALRGNLQRCGVVNAIVTETDGRNFLKSGITFSKILLDAPCTGTGLLSPRILQTTSENTIRRLSHTQRQLLFSASRCLEKDGVLVYSTCSLEPEENERNMDYAIDELGLVVEEIKLDGMSSMNGITEWEGKKFNEDVSKAVRIVPNEIFEGFFVCKLRKY